MATIAKAKAKAKAEPQEIEEISEPPLKYKTWVLRVSVHCEGCKKKINKILKGMEGVYNTQVDMRLQKVTVTGNVEAETLIKKLTKSGKHAELWRDPKPNNSNDKNKGKGKHIEKQQRDCDGSEESNHGGPGGGGDNEKETLKVEVVQAQGSSNKKKNEGGGPAGNKKADMGNMVKPNEGGGAPAKTGGGGQVRESKLEVVRQGGNLPNHPPVAEKKSGDSESNCEVEKSGGDSGGGVSGSGSKNKKKKGPNGNANAEEDKDEECSDAPPSTGSPNYDNVPRGPHVSQDPPGPRVPYGLYGSHLPSAQPYGPHGPGFAPAPANYSPLQQHVYEREYQRYRPPMQAVHYNAGFATNSYGASHYDAPAPNSESFTEPQPASYHLDNCASQPYYPYDQPSYNLPQPSNSYGLFSDENPNGCCIM